MEGKKRSNIAVIVVTYNRIELLKNCIRAIRNQSFNDFDIIVVNNDSTDGTNDWLMFQNDIEIITQKNIGGSGGFHNGIGYAYEKGYDFFWIMDDDGVPNNDCLEKLLTTAQKGFHYVAPNLITFDGKNHFENITKSDERVISHIGGPFNAILLSRILISKVGLPNIYYFIWGDEYEFVNRVKENYFFTALVKDAIHHHKLTEENPKVVESRIYYKVRNMIWSARLNKGIVESKKIRNVSVAYNIIRYLLRYALKLRFIAIKDLLRGVKDGINIKYEYLIGGSSFITDSKNNHS